MRKITCHCEQTFSADIPEHVNLDESPETLAQVASGQFLACVCPTCEAELHLDLKTTFDWPSRGVIITLIPELERISVLSGTYKARDGESVVIGYPELADRLSVLSAGLEPIAIEALKYLILSRASETNPSSSPTLLFEGQNDSGELIFHAHGLREGEVAVTTVPRRLYDSLMAEYVSNPRDERFTALVNGPYCSVRNVTVGD